MARNIEDLEREKAHKEKMHSIVLEKVVDFVVDCNDNLIYLSNGSTRVQRQSYKEMSDRLDDIIKGAMTHVLDKEGHRPGTELVRICCDALTRRNQAKNN